MFADGTSSGSWHTLWLAVFLLWLLHRFMHGGDRPSKEAGSHRRLWLAASLDDPGLWLFGAVYWMLLSSAWLLTVGAAAVGGIIAALVTSDPCSLVVVLVGGSLMGWLTTLGYIVMLVFVETAGASDTNYDEPGGSDLLAWGVGPAVAIVVAVAVMLIW